MTQLEAQIEAMRRWGNDAVTTTRVYVVDGCRVWHFEVGIHTRSGKRYIGGGETFEEAFHNYDTCTIEGWGEQ
jgi:hypothetical protein